MPCKRWATAAQRFTPTSSASSTPPPELNCGSSETRPRTSPQPSRHYERFDLMLITLIHLHHVIAHVIIDGRPPLSMSTDFAPGVRNVGPRHPRGRSIGRGYGGALGKIVAGQSAGPRGMARLIRGVVRSPSFRFGNLGTLFDFSLVVAVCLTFSF